jgi:hypothetical protein
VDHDPVRALVAAGIDRHLDVGRQGGAGAARRRSRRCCTAVPERFRFDESHQPVIDYVVLAAGKVVVVFDRAIVNEHGVNGTGQATDFLG